MPGGDRLALVIDGLLGVYSDPATQCHRYPSGRLTHFFGVVFTARAVRRCGDPNDECTEIAFFPLDHLPGPLFGPDVPVLHDAAAAPSAPVID